MIHIRTASILDVKEIFEWRNDKLAVEMSLNENQIKWSTHKKWFEKILNSQKHCLLICIHKKDKIKVGYVRFDIISNEANISINLSPVMRGKGLAKECLIKSMLFFNKKFNKILTVNAKVKPKNLASIRVFDKAGFHITEKTKDILLHKYIFKKS